MRDVVGILVVRSYREPVLQSLNGLDHAWGTAYRAP